MKSWLKGGLWGAGIYTVLTLANLIPLIGVFFRPLSTLLNFLGFAIITQLVSDRQLFYDWYSHLFPTIYGFLFSLVLWFIIGAIIGWIVGKIKSKK